MLMFLKLNRIISPILCLWTFSFADRLFFTGLGLKFVLNIQETPEDPEIKVFLSQFGVEE